jgi:uncharacterized membrane protein YtjA (UPF0391 family)
MSMLRWAAVFFVIALIAAVLGFSGIVSDDTAGPGIAKILFFVFLVLGNLSLIFGQPVPRDLE